MQSMEDNCTLLLQPRKTTGGAQTSIGDLKAKLESTNEDDKVEALKHIITGLLNGEEMRSMLMHVIRFACTSSHHKLKRLLMIYWECVPKRGDDGKLLPEMILVCNALRNDLNHANEYIRGCTLRLCTKLREREVIEPLIPSITANLEHRHAYVRRNAVIAIFAIYKSLPALIPNGPELVDNFLQTEPDLAAKRNAFLMLFQCGQDRAIAYMHRVLDQVPSMGDGFQLVVLELARKLCRSHPQEKSRYIKCIITLMETATDTVLFECANTLVAVSNAPTAIGNCFTKLVLRAASLKVTQPELNKMTCEAMLVVVGLLRAGSAQNTPSPTHHPMDAGSIARLTVCLRTLSDPHTWPVASKVLLVDTRDAFTAVLAEQTLRAKKDAPQKDAVDEKIAQADDVIVFRQLKGSKTIMSQLDIEDEEFADVSRAVGSGNQDNDFSARLSRMVQLTGFSDPIYAEAFVAVHHYDIVLDIFVVNKSNDTMQNLMVELSTVGDLKLCERPQCHTLAPGTSKNIKVNIKVSSTETGVVFGSIVYDTTGAGGDRNCVLLNDIHIDIMDYLHPAPCSDIEFRAMWAEFEWENKVFVNTKISDLNELLQHIIASTNMACLTSSSTLEGDCSVLSANLHAKSVFGESALLNLSVERLPFGKISGFVRIRSKTQGIALGLGDKVTLCQQQQHTPQHSQPQHQPRSSSSK
eukprot:c12600_g1_i1.p1 GENE.c12600_g1_i1~~c12600_g1_i1.p1  ORF type:complete len:695 (+),score=215.02 c12600_g1_i1:35-2119(+)